MRIPLSPASIRRKFESGGYGELIASGVLKLRKVLANTRIGEGHRQQVSYVTKTGAKAVDVEQTVDHNGRVIDGPHPSRIYVQDDIFVSDPSASEEEP